MLALMLTLTSAYASFPVKRAATATTTENVTTTETTESIEMSTPAAMASGESKGIALILWFFLGGIAAHRWYLKSPVGWNILFILTIGGIGIWAIIDLIDIFYRELSKCKF